MKRLQSNLRGARDIPAVRAMGPMLVLLLAATVSHARHAQRRR
ncbi:MAG: hypothetical protein NT154_16165 [Verrucomicrobia bacterium]|nr:hypothetical protein [Verrucomicrobiota bacterium]